MWTDALVAGLQRGDQVLDVGANMGALAEAALPVTGPGTIVAIEPDDRCWPALTALGATVWTCVAWDTIGETVPFYVAGADATLSSAYRAAIDGEAREESRQTITVDAVATGLSRLRLVKIDAQGAEARILEGARQTLARPGLRWCVELWPAVQGDGVETVICTFERRGARVLAATKELRSEPWLSWADVRDRVARLSGPHIHTNLLVECP